MEKRRYTQEEKAKLLAECQSSNLSKKAWCQEQNIGTSTLYKWQQETESTKKSPQ